MTGTVLIRVDGGHRLGLGHVKRCLALAEKLTGRAVRCVFACRGAGISGLIRDSGYTVIALPDAVDFKKELEALAADSRFDADVCVLDISQRDTFQKSDAVPGYFNALHKRFPAVAVVDGLLGHCLVGEFDLPVDLAFIPYAGAGEKRVRSHGAQLALGPDYFILDASYSAVIGEARDIPAAARKILVTAGGSDPEGLTLKTLDALARIDGPKLDIRVAIGPAFADDEIEEISEAAERSGHDVALLKRPESLAAHIAWSDMAVSASGLTKYELAALGTPAILLSIDEGHAGFNRSFDACGTTRHLGVVKDVLASELAKSILQLANDPLARAELSAAGRAFLDGRGTERSAAAIIGLIDKSAEGTCKLNVSEATR